ncbi:MAG: alanine--tRNA ligase [Chitinophagaceae bacterium]
MTSAEIRSRFLKFFESKGHTIVPSAPIVLKNDPTLLFTNAGMNQFKDYFLGNKQAPYSRAVDTQKCLRVSGKHNDLEEVGVDTYHHTMFEMLGNWSFGDYFKKEAIEWSWELLTEVYGLDKSRLYATVFEGDAKENLPASKIALSVWKGLLPDEHIVFGNKKDNFWEMGDTGPCGPCSEIHVDCRSDEERAKTPGHLLVNKDHPQVIEIWNNVFIQYNRMKDGSLQPLASTHVDTGMGLERLVRVLQGKTSNYDTDIFSGTIQTIEKISGKKYEGSDAKKDVAFRVLADHIRAIAFTIADGQLPSNTGAGYVIRRILRRAVRYYYSYLEVKEPLLYQLLPGLAEQFKEVFGELMAQLSFVEKVVREEEETFLKTLGKGLKKMDDLVAQAKQSGVVDGAAAFELYDTYGFPIDLTRLIAQELALTVDEKGFEAEMSAQKNRSKAATASDVGDWMTVSKSDASSVFIGYSNLSTSTELLRYRKVNTKGQSFYQLVLAETPFYAESGGQVGDTGTISMNGSVLEVTNTKKENDLIVHTVTALPDQVTASVVASVDSSRRKEITAHHTLTHLIHAALRAVLGSHVAQKGSLVDNEGMRFDFSHFAKMTEVELSAVEKMVNLKIRENIPVVIRTMPKDEALQLGAMALFGEKYGETVRVVTIDPNYSVELCGGTHVMSTGELGYCMLTSESGVAAGVRRIEAICSVAAEREMMQQRALLEQLKEMFKQPKDILKAIEGQAEELHALKKQLEAAEAKMLLQLRKELAAGFKHYTGCSFLGVSVEVGSPDALKKLCNDLRNEADDRMIVLTAVIGGKPFVAVGLSDALQKVKGLDAGQIIKTTIAPLIKGGGGGQKTLATAGGQETGGLPSVLTSVQSLLG